MIIATTHLKSSKSASGERYREKGVLQILNDTDRIYQKMSAADRTPVVLFLGDFNAVPEERDYPPLTYRAVKSHQLGLRRYACLDWLRSGGLSVDVQATPSP